MSEIPELNKRFLHVLEHYNYTAYKFSTEVGNVSQTALGHIKNGRNKPGMVLIEALLNKFPEINKTWLLDGKGEMLSTLEDNINIDTEFAKMSLEDKLAYLHDENLQLKNKIRLTHNIEKAYLRMIVNHLGIKKENLKEVEELEDSMKKISSN